MEKETDYKQLYEEELDFSAKIIVFLLLVLVFATVFELTLLIVGYAYADNFTKTISFGDETKYGGVYSNSTIISSISSYTNITSKCYIDSKEVNCKEAAI